MKYFLNPKGWIMIAYDEETSSATLLAEVDFAGASALDVSVLAPGKVAAVSEPKRRGRKPGTKMPPKKAKPAVDEWDTYKPPISEKNYKLAIEMRMLEDKNALQVAHEMNVEVSEVNYAFMSPNYQDYFSRSRREALG